VTSTANKRSDLDQPPGPQLSAPSVYLKTNSLNRRFNRDPSLNRENTACTRHCFHSLGQCNNTVETFDDLDIKDNVESELEIK